MLARLVQSSAAMKLSAASITRWAGSAHSAFFNLFIWLYALSKISVPGQLEVNIMDLRYIIRVRPHRFVLTSKT